MQPGDILPLEFNPGMVVLSCMIAVLGAYVALLATARIRTARGGAHPGYVVVAAIALGGVGIWGTHFVGMIAQALPFDVAYDLKLNLLSLLVAVGFSGAALWYVGGGPFSARRCLAAGVLAGCGIAGMHYLGVASMRMDAYYEWDLGMVGLSVLIAMAAATVALWLSFSVRRELHRIVAAIVMGAAVCGAHYVAQVAGIMVCTTPRTFRGLQLEGAILPYAVCLISAVTLIVMRIELYRSSEDVRANAALQVDRMLVSRQWEEE